MPRPPIWIRETITICPTLVKVEPVSTTTRPVTHVAEVAVNRASIQEMALPFRLKGMWSSVAPLNITNAKNRMGKAYGEILIFIMIS